MQKGLFGGFGRIIGRKRFKSDIIAAHALRPDGCVAGVIDECGPSRLRGWVYDAERPDAALELEIIVDGNCVRKIKADLLREDISALLGDAGLHGFECDIGFINWPNARKRLITLRLADLPGYEFGPLEIQSHHGSPAPRSAATANPSIASLDATEARYQASKAQRDIENYKLAASKPSAEPIEFDARGSAVDSLRDGKPQSEVAGGLEERLKLVLDQALLSNEATQRKLAALNASFERLQSTQNMLSEALSALEEPVSNGEEPRRANMLPLKISEELPDSLRDRLSHIFDHVTAVHDHLFDHITAAHEDSLRRFDHLKETLDNARMGLGRAQAANFDGTSAFLEISRSGISGVGQFGAILDDEVEIALFRSRLEAEIVRARYFS